MSKIDPAWQLIIAFILAASVIFVPAYLFSGDAIIASMAQMAEVITGVAAVVAVVSFVAERNRDQSLTKKELAISALEQLTYFEEKVIPLYETIVASRKPDEKLRADALDSFTLEWLVTNRHDAYAAQQEAYKAFKSTDILLFLNKLELLSERIVFLSVLDHPALIAIKDSYVQFVEEFCGPILSLKMAKPQNYEGVRKVYLAWRVDVERTSVKELMERSADKVVALVNSGAAPDAEKILKRFTEKK